MFFTTVTETLVDIAEIRRSLTNLLQGVGRQSLESIANNVFEGSLDAWTLEVY